MPGSLEGGWGSNRTPPPSIFLSWYKSTIKYVFVKPLGSTSTICKKMTNLQKSKYLLRYLVRKQKLCKKLRKLQKNIHFWKSLDLANLNLQILNSLNVYSRKTENLQISFKCLAVQKSVQNFFAKVVQSASCCYMTGSRSKYRFSLE